MKIEDYNSFYEKVISGYIKELLDYDSDYGWHVLTLNEKSRGKIYKYYERKRIEIRNGYMIDPQKPIDRHKTAASMMYAILKAKVFKIEKTKGPLPAPLKLANEYLAFYTAMNIIEQYKRTDEGTEGQKSTPDYKLIIPHTAYESQKNDETGDVENSFITSICLTLANIKSINYFDVFSYATIMFLLEKNTDNIIAREKQIKELKEKAMDAS